MVQSRFCKPAAIQEAIGGGNLTLKVNIFISSVGLDPVIQFCYLSEQGNFVTDVNRKGVDPWVTKQSSRTEMKQEPKTFIDEIALLHLEEELSAGIQKELSK